MPDDTREDRLRTAMRVADLDALVCRLPEDVLLLSGYWPMTGLSFAWFPLDGDPVLIVPEGERSWAEAARWKDVRTFAAGDVHSGDPLQSVAGHLRDLVRRRSGPRGPRIGYEGSFETVAPAHVSGECVAVARPTREMLEAVFEATPHDATQLITEQRAVKTPGELAGVRRAAAVADLGCETFRQVLRPGAAECEVAAAVEAVIHARGVGFEGATRARAWATVLAGAGSDVAWRPFQVSRARPIQEGESAILELGVVVDGYWADLTRTCVAGEPSDRQRSIHALVLAAHDAAIAAMRPGISGSEVDHAARRLIESSGFGPQFVHQTGHGLGFRYHETMPLLHPSYHKPLAAGMVTSVEPGIYLTGAFGLRIEDDVLVTESGAESLSQASRDL